MFVSVSRFTTFLYHTQHGTIHSLIESEVARTSLRISLPVERVLKTSAEKDSVRTLLSVLWDYRFVTCLRQRYMFHFKI
jgi:hypothetical protein